MTVSLNFDSHGELAPPPSAIGCQATLTKNKDGTFTLIVYALTPA
jgi:hypothetical protein